MPPIPKFAKALAKLAKANPKVISGKTPPKIKKRNTSEKTIEKQIETKKFAKDDMEIDKISREKIKKELEQSLPKKAKDDSDLLMLARRLQKINDESLTGDEVYKYIGIFKNFFNVVNSKFDRKSPISDALGIIINQLNNSEKINPEEINDNKELISKISFAVKKLESLVKGAK